MDTYVKCELWKCILFWLRDCVNFIEHLVNYEYVNGSLLRYTSICVCNDMDVWQTTFVDVENLWNNIKIIIMHRSTKCVTLYTFSLWIYFQIFHHQHKHHWFWFDVWYHIYLYSHVMLIFLFKWDFHVFILFPNSGWIDW